MKTVVDTNTVVSAIVFPRGRLTWIRDLWETRSIVPLVCRETSEELIRVLAYPKFRLEQGEIEILLASYLPYAEVVKLPSHRPRELPRCSDPDDDVFLRLAAAGNAQVLVTGDRALMALRKRVTFSIETASELRRRFG